MRLPSRFALNATSGLATVLFALHSEHVAASKNDPFALPGKDFRVDDLSPASKSDPSLQNPQTQPADDYIFFADVALNGEPLRGIAKIKMVDDELAIEAAFAFAKGLTPIFPDQEYIALSSVRGMTYDFNWQNYRLNITKDLHSSGANLIDMQKRSHGATSAADHIPAFIVDYDLSLQANRAGLHGIGHISPRFAHENTVVETSFRVSTEKQTVGGRTTRLDSFISHRMPASSTSVTVGDFISQGPAGSRAVRMGGLRIGTDFSLRSDLITKPLPDFTGTVAVPTGIDVLVNDRRVTSNDVERGEFTVQSIPVPLGRSEVGVVVRDALGRERLQTVPFYSARSLLAPGLFEGAINIGAVRRRFGVSSNDYGPPAITAMARKGIRNSLTLTSLAEASNGVINGGFGADMVIANAALVSLTARASRNNEGPTGLRSGHLVSLGIESTGEVFSASLEAREVSDGYADVASANGDNAPPSLIAANINFDLAEFGRLQVSAVWQSQPDRPRLDRDAKKLRLISASYRNQIWRGATVSLDLSRRVNNGRKDFSALIGLSVSLGNRKFGQTSYSRAQDRGFFQASFSRPAIEPGDTGYSASLGLGSADRIAGSISRQLRFGRFELQAEHVDGSNAARFNARGSLLATEGSIFATKNEGGHMPWWIAGASKASPRSTKTVRAA